MDSSWILIVCGCCFMASFSGGFAQSPLDSLDCSYENATNQLCGFTQDDTDDFDWTWHAGSTATENTGPRVDHTYGTEQGHYIYTESSLPRTPNDLARLISPVLASSSEAKCLSLYYHLNGEDVGALRILLRVVNATDSDVLKQWQGDQGDRWTKASITIPKQDDVYQIIFESEVGESYQGDMAIDDIIMTSDACPLESLICPFETKKICGFEQDKTDNFNFKWNTGHTGRQVTGPQADHTYKNESGHYMYIESARRQEGHVARITSPMLAGHGGQPSCLIFFYHMYGERMGDLNVYIKNSTSDGLGNPVWALTGNRGNKWRAAEAEITTPHDYQVVFEAIRGDSWRGDISIDDVNVTFAPCPGHYVIKNESSVTCDFEEAELCYYTQEKDDQFDWTWGNRGTSWRFTGPSVDHTRGDEIGFFLYIDAGWATPRNALARISSPEVPAQRRSSCLEFWYHMYGKDVEELKVYVKASDEELPDTPEWRKSGDHGDAWHRATIDIDMRNIPFKIVFEGKRGTFRRDDIALDDIRIFEGSPCPSNPTDPPMPTTTPVPRSDIGCTFEQDYCNYTQAIDDIFDWKRQAGTMSKRFQFDTVSIDHTRGNGKGQYMLLAVTQWWSHRTNDNARLVSPLLRGSPNPRCLKFWFILNGRYADYLNVYTVRHGDTLTFDPDLTLYGDHGLEWTEQYVDVPPSTYPIYVVFEGVIGYLWWSPDTAIDDISVVQGMCPTTTPKPLPVNADCTFEGADEDEAMCGFTQETIDDPWYMRPTRLYWQLNTGPTSTNDTGPTFDHTFRNISGQYLYTEASQPQRPGMNARVSSPMLTSGGRRICVQFYYHMSGKETGSLSVLRSAPNFPEKEIVRLTKVSSRWSSAYIEINDIVDQYQITFEATVGNGNRGDIAIDDIRFLTQPCSGFEPESTCGFDMGYEACNYRQDDADVIEWVWFDSKGTEPSPLANTSVPVGSFLYITGQSKGSTTSAVIRPPMIPTKKMDHCIMYDVIVQNDPQAKLVMSVEYNGNSWRTMQTVNMSTSPKWSHYELTLPLDILTEDPFQLRFISYFGSNRQDGIIAIDNVTISQASCDVVKAKMSRQSGESDGRSRADVALGSILALVILSIVAMLVVAWYFVRRSSGLNDSPFAIKYKNQDENVNPVSLSGEPGIANPVYEKAGLENNA